ncbi:hypothetical protein M8818_006396 [Zalaria obscura]|uniref:Uncharacterized protein n=1 Tax=Zalaria obscura TaxID=2024903 RepID=A0ACC3S5U4_9PEZI
MEEVIRRLSASTIPQTPRAPSWSPLTSPEPETESRSSENSLRSSTSATTFAPPDPPSVSPSLKRKHNQISGEAQDFFSDLENYLPLGCLLLADSVANEQQFVRKPRFWEEYHQIPEAEDWDSNLKDDLAHLLAARWIRIFALPTEEASAYILRVYLLPGDVGHRFIERQGKRLALAVEKLIRHIDVSSKTWSGTWNGRRRSPFEKWASRDEGSLYYMFNMIPSPAPTSAEVQAHYSREALECLLDPATQLTGLKSSLYPYQRRSAALMIQRESETRLELDPRLESRTAPDGTTYYYGARDLLFLRNPRMYESCKGGILAETMGLGKTIISVALILATKGHLPRVPVQYERPVIRRKVGSLADMAISSVNRHSVPWRTYFDSLKAATGEEMTTCIDLMQRNPPTYEIPIEPIRFNRKTTVPPPKKITLASTTIIVVPRNLCSQWQTELRKHTDAGALSLLLMDNPRKELPPPEQLRTYDIILFSRPRFEQEIRDGSDDKGRRMSKLPLSCACPYIGASRKRDCTCLRVDDLYDSPLKHLHFLRIIIDEGHFFSSASSVAAQVAEKLVRADHRWVVSGTPAKDLLGVEMDLSGADAISGTSNEKAPREGLLIQRKEFNLQDDTMGAIKSLGSLASHFLRIRPWAASYSGERPAEWDDYIYRHEDLRKRTFSGFSKCLRRFLESTVVKTRPEDVERDIELPPLVHRTILLEPSFYDKLTTNLFTLVLTANAVTSERTDADYLFHKNSAKARYQLIHNLRQSAFFWTGFSEADIVAAVKHGEGYLEKEDTRCTSQDRRLLIQCIEQAQVALSSPGWKALSKTHEIGLFVEDWPSESESLWSFAEFARPMLTGVTQLLDAQSHVNEQAHLIDATEGLAGAGIRATAPLRAEERPVSSGKKAENPALVKSGIPVSTMTGEPNRRSAVSHNGIKKLKSQVKGKQQKLHFKVTKEKHSEPQDIQKLTDTQESTDSRIQPDNQVITPSKNIKGSEKVPQVVPQLLPSDSPLLNTRILRGLGHVSVGIRQRTVYRVYS